MTVQELIAALQELPSDMRVIIGRDDGSYTPLVEEMLTGAYDDGELTIGSPKENAVVLFGA